MSVFFSIILPTYNRAHLITESIHSVLNQDSSNFELIIVDDGSTDNTKEVVAGVIKNNSDKQIKYIYQPNQERAASRNNGLKQAKGEYVIFFDSDDSLYPHHLKTIDAYLRSHSSAEFLHFRYDVKNDKGEKIKEGPIYSTFANKELIKGNFLSCNGVVLKKEIALQNLFNELRALSAMEDWELWLRLAAKYPIHYINTITSTIINHDNRSVLITDSTALINRINSLMQLVLSNKDVVSYFKKNLNAFRCSCYSYVSLHLALTKTKKNVLYTYLKAFLSIHYLFFKNVFTASLNIYFEKH